MEQLNVGDVVYLKSGGPAMTIRKKNTNNECYCEWFNKEEELKSSLFSIESLTKIEIKKTVPKDKANSISHSALRVKIMSYGKFFMPFHTK